VVSYLDDKVSLGSRHLSAFCNLIREYGGHYTFQAFDCLFFIIFSERCRVDCQIRDGATCRVVVIVGSKVCTGSNKGAVRSNLSHILSLWEGLLVHNFRHRGRWVCIVHFKTFHLHLLLAVFILGFCKGSLLWNKGFSFYFFILWRWWVHILVSGGYLFCRGVHLLWMSKLFKWAFDYIHQFIIELPLWRYCFNGVVRTMLWVRVIRHIWTWDGVPRLVSLWLGLWILCISSEILIAFLQCFNLIYFSHQISLSTCD